MRNARDTCVTPAQVSQLERHMNWLVVLVFGEMIVLSIIMATGHGAFLASDDRWYIYTQGKMIVLSIIMATGHGAFLASDDRWYVSYVYTQDK
eukprot:5603414-Pyramimonas_sp.AAC.2